MLHHIKSRKICPIETIFVDEGFQYPGFHSSELLRGNRNVSMKPLSRENDQIVGTDTCMLH